MAVSITITPEGIYILRVRGKLLAVSLEDLKKALNGLGPKALVVINLKGAQMADSVAVGYLVRRHGILYQGGGGMALCCLHPNVSKLLAVGGLNKHFTVYDSEEEAVAALKSAYAAVLPPPKKRGRKPKDKNTGDKSAE